MSQPSGAKICVSSMPALKAKKLGKPPQKKVLLELWSRLANSIRPFSGHGRMCPQTIHAGVQIPDTVTVCSKRPHDPHVDADAPLSRVRPSLPSVPMYITVIYFIAWLLPTLTLLYYSNSVIQMTHPHEKEAAHGEAR